MLWNPRLRRFVGLAVLLGGLAWVGAGLLRDAPRETTVALRVGDQAGALGQAEIAYWQGDARVAYARFREPDGFPSRVSHDVLLPAGRIVARVALYDAGGAPVRSIRRTFVVPVDGDSVDLVLSGSEDGR